VTDAIPGTPKLKRRRDSGGGIFWTPEPLTGIPDWVVIGAYKACRRAALTMLGWMPYLSRDIDDLIQIAVVNIVRYWSKHPSDIPIGGARAKTSIKWAMASLYGDAANKGGKRQMHHAMELHDPEMMQAVMDCETTDFARKLGAALRLRDGTM
jgi:hypothetical protein